ncbi:MAG: DUF87 domain-containing protein [Thermodesulfobacteriota bacterium]|nr:DUF87 domain-containing protein [Thermodesulfobacteriota bacterium]
MAGASDYEKMDLFYLGRELDPETGETNRQPLLYKNKHLTTHAAIIGMTGSGKTGLGIDLIEEAALDKLPSIIIDPKGDMTNLLLSFPDLAADDFEPWVDEGQAAQKGISRKKLAVDTAAAWEKGLASWDQDKERIGRMRASADFVVYTPGSSSGRPVSVLDSMEAPDPEVLKDNDTAAALVNSTVSSILALVGVKADPLKSREHILLSSIVLYYWRKQQDLSLEMLIAAVVNPPFTKIGSLTTDVFYPQPKRMDLALQLNNILASPAFSGWTQGEPLRIENFLYSDSGKPQVSIFSIAHLSDDERMFFVAMLLGRFISWMRRQEGSSGLRCLLYMDEIFGYFPPSANPPSKKPMLLLLKQARAYGVGVVLSTQNPVDLDYKGLSNIGTWFVGRLQTRQDQDRVMAGIAGSSDDFSEQQIREMLSDMRGRTFLLYSAHQDEPVLFETRWAMSYLRGPVSLSEIGKMITKGIDHDSGDQSTVAQSVQAAITEGYSSTPPMLSAGVEQCFLPAPIPVEELNYAPWLVGTSTVRFFKQSQSIDETREICLRLPVNDDIDKPDWQQAEEYSLELDDCEDRAPEGSRFASLPAAFSSLKNLRGLEKVFDNFLYHSMRLPLMKVTSLKLTSKPGETEAQFNKRIADLLRGKKEIEADKVTERYGKKQRLLETRLEKAYARLDKEKGDVTAKGIDTALSVGVAVFGALFGRKTLSVSTATRTARSMRGAGRVLKEQGDVQRAGDAVTLIQDDIDALARELQGKLSGLADRFDPVHYDMETINITPRHSDIYNLQLRLVWEPVLDLAEVGNIR